MQQRVCTLDSCCTHAGAGVEATEEAAGGSRRRRSASTRVLRCCEQPGRARRPPDRPELVPSSTCSPYVVHVVADRYWVERSGQVQAPDGGQAHVPAHLLQHPYRPFAAFHSVGPPCACPCRPFAVSPVRHCRCRRCRRRCRRCRRSLLWSLVTATSCSTHTPENSTPHTGTGEVGQRTRRQKERRRSSVNSYLPSSTFTAAQKRASPVSLATRGCWRCLRWPTSERPRARRSRQCLLAQWVQRT